METSTPKPIIEDEGIYLGAEFDSFEHFDRTFKVWCRQKNVKYSILNSQTILSVNNRLGQGALPYDPKFRYKSARFVCVRGGAPRRLKDHIPGELPKPTRSAKQGCPAFLVITVSKFQMDKLVIEKFNPYHNHSGSLNDDEYSFDGFFGQRKDSFNSESSSTFEQVNPVPTIEEQQYATIIPDKFPISPASTSTFHATDNTDCHESPRLPTITKLRSLSERRPQFGLSADRRPHRKRTFNRSHQQSMETLKRKYPEMNHHATNQNATSSTSQVDVNQAFMKLIEDQQNRDEEDIFCQGLAMKLRTFDPSSRSRIKIQIQTLIHNIEFSESPVSLEMGLENGVNF